MSPPTYLFRGAQLNADGRKGKRLVIFQGSKWVNGGRRGMQRIKYLHLLANR